VAYLQSQIQDPDVYYSLINFSNADRTLLIQNFTNNLAGFTNIIQNEWNPGNTNPPQPDDGGWTDYLAATSVIASTIQQDAFLESQKPDPATSDYAIIFISDGAPFFQNGQPIPPQQVLNGIDGLISLQTGAYKTLISSITASTGYYYSDNFDASAESLMKQMAQRGNGYFFQFGAGQAIDFNQFASPIRQVENKLRDFMVRNVNTVWFQGKLRADSDGDGLADVLEDLLGSNALLADSDKNGVNDGIEYRLTGKACKDGKCSPANAEPYLSCNQFLDPNQPGRVFKDTDKDKDSIGLDDCAEFLLGSISKDPDSNADWISDPLAFRSSLAFIPGQNDSLLDPFTDGMTNYTKVKINAPLDFSTKRILDFKPQKYSLEIEERKQFQTCYKGIVEQIGVFGNDNLVKVYEWESPAIMDNRKYYRVAQKKANGPRVIFYDSDFVLIK
jgi:hypothetical protein